MTCFGPLTAYRPPKNSGDKRLVFDKRKSETGIAIKIPCGQCSGCRLERSRQWAMRCWHEKMLHIDSSFLTLTYNDEHMPKDGSLSMDDYQRFMKRLRWRFGDGIRFAGCGEYGDNFGRPHYHILLLNRDFPDRKYWSKSPSGESLYTSEELVELWSDDRGPIGHSVIGNVSFDSAAYVARYIMKKIKGNAAEAHYAGRLPEFFTMSRRPGLGKEWFNKYGVHAYTHDSVIMRGQEVRPPKYYDGLYEILQPEELARLKVKRRRKAAMYRCDQTTRRLRVREVVALAKLSQKRRSL